MTPALAARLSVFSVFVASMLYLHYRGRGVANRVYRIVYYVLRWGSVAGARFLVLFAGSGPLR